MPLIFKKAAREDLRKLSVFVEDNSPNSPKYFRVSDTPQVLTKGKNLLRISAHPTNLVDNTQILIDVRDSNGNPIYFEIPDYLEKDKSRVISIWVYHDKGDDNTANGDAIITLVGIAKNNIPTKYIGKPNVRWQTVVNVDRDRKNTSSVLFQSNNIPAAVVSESIETYTNQPQADSKLELTSQTASGAKYFYKGDTPIVQLTDGSTFNSEMLNYSIVLSNFTTPAEPNANFKNPNSSTFHSSSIKKLIDNTTAVLSTAFTTSFDGYDKLRHTYDYIDSAEYEVNYFQSGSNVSTENQRSFANITLNGIDPIAGVVDKVKVLIKSEGLPGEYELLNEVTIPFSSSVDIKVPIPSENLEDPKRLKIQYLNASGEISRTETITDPFVFEGGNSYIGGTNNLISGSMFISNAIGSGIEMGGISSGFIRSVGFDGQTSASLGKGPGGFIIYSGSGNMLIGDDVLHGVGMQMVGDNDDRHFIFSTHDGGLLDVKTDKFFIGTYDSQFISGSDSNIEISSSLFHLDPKNNSLVIGAGTIINAALSADEIFTPATINGVQSTILNASASITSDGFARFVSASIGGFEVSTTQINSANDNLILKDSGQITGSTVLFSGGKVAGFEISNSQINSTNDNLILKASGQITASDGFLFGNKASSQYVQYDDGNLVVRGDLSVDRIFTPATIAGSPANITNASSSITSDGFARFVSASIGGFEVSTTQINSANDNLILRDNGQITGSTVLLSGGTIGGFELTSTQINSANDNLILKSNGQITASSANINGDIVTGNITATGGTIGGITMGTNVLFTGDGRYLHPDTGFYIDEDGQFSLGDKFGWSHGTLSIDGDIVTNNITATGGTIGGINMAGGKLFNGVGTFNNSNTGFYVDSGSNFSLGDKFGWDGSTLSITGNITVSNPNDFADSNADDSSTSAVFNKIISPTTQVLASDGRPAGFYSAYGTSVKTDIASTDLADGNGKVLELYSATDSTIGVITQAVETQSDVSYKLRITVKGDVADSTALYFRIYELDALTGTDASSTAVSFTNNSLKGVSFAAEAEDGVAVSVTREIKFSPSAPAGGTQFIDQSDGTTILNTENGPIYTTYKTYEATYTPTATAQLFSLGVISWSGFSGHMYIKDVQIIPLGVAQGSQIGGDNIKTGTLQSINLSPSQGSILELNAGTMKIGGTSNPGLDVTSDGFVTVTNIVEKIITVAAGNKTLYYENYGAEETARTRLILDGSLGGDVTMNMVMEVGPDYQIGDIQFPTNAGSDGIANLELKILVDGVQFDEAVVTSGYSAFISDMAAF